MLVAVYGQLVGAGSTRGRYDGVLIGEQQCIRIFCASSRPEGQYWPHLSQSEWCSERPPLPSSVDQPIDVHGTPISLDEAQADTTIALSPKNLNAPTIVEGVVTKDGIPAPEVGIVARIWPNVEQQSIVPAGEGADVRIVHLSETDSRGRYEVRLDPGLVPKTHIEPNGSVSVQLWAVTGGGEMSWNLSVLTPDEVARMFGDRTAEWSTETIVGAGDVAPPAVDFEIGEVSAVSQRDSSQSLWLSDDHISPMKRSMELEANSLDFRANAVAVPLASTQCWSVIPAGGTWYYNNRERFMNVYGWSGARPKVSQAVSASSSHTLGVGYKANSGGWGANGTTSISISSSAGQTTGALLNHGIYNSVNYRLWNCGLPENNTYVVGKELRPAGFYDIFNEPFLGLSHANYTLGCVTKSSGVVWKNSGTNATFSAGVTTPLMSLSARSGYNTGTKISFTVTAKSKICGNSASGWISASQVDMRAG